MTYLYREILIDGSRAFIQRLSDTAFIPLDTENTDYKEFLRQCEELGESAILESTTE